MSETFETVAPEATAKRKQRTQGQDQRTLAERMAAVMGRLVPPPKNGSMQMQGKRIPYVQNDDLMDCLRPALAAEGVAYSISVEDVRKGLADPVGVMLRVRLASAEEALEGNAYGEGRTFPIAQTYAVKYWLLRTFLVGSGGEDDEIANVEPEPDPRPASNRRQAPPAPPPPGTNPAYRMLAALAQKVHQEPKPLQAVIDTLAAEGIIAEELGVVNRLTDLPLSIVERAVAHYRALAEESR